MCCTTRGMCQTSTPTYSWGRDWLGSYYRPVSTTVTGDVTTMTLSPLMPDELQARVSKLMIKGREARQGCDADHGAVRMSGEIIDLGAMFGKDNPMCRKVFRTLTHKPQG